MRNFEFISLSADAENDAEKARSFLEKQGAGVSPSRARAIKEQGRTTNHYRFHGGPMDELMKALDPQWPGGVPYTVLVSPQGEILWRHSGAIDPVGLKEEILKAMGTVYQP